MAGTAGGRPAGLAVHATAVAIGGATGGGLLIRGASGAGKSALAFALIRAATPGRPVALVGDDRLLLRRDGTGVVVARPHPRIAGFIERRGLGLVAMPWRDRAVLAGCVTLGAVAPGGEAEPWLRALPLLRLPRLDPSRPAAADEACRDVLRWWDGLAGRGSDAAAGTQVA